MKLVLPWDKRASVYDRASAMLITAVPLAIIGTALIFSGALLGWIMACGGLLLGYLLPRCPRCGKPPMQKRLLDRASPFHLYWTGGRLWPEHICSGCGDNLTMPPRP